MIPPYLTRVRINPRRRQSQRYLSDPHRMHGAVLAGFPEDPTGDSSTGRVLWRLDNDDPRRPLLWVLSPARPDYSALVEEAGWPESDVSGFETRSYRPVVDGLTSGEHYAFRLTANPVHNVKVGGNGRTKRMGHVTATQQIAWLTDRTENWGFTIPEGTGGEPNLRLIARNRQTFFRRREGDAKPRRVTLTTATYEGEMIVTDPDRLRSAITGGVGHAKAYGCGLMTLASVSQVAQ